VVVVECVRLGEPRVSGPGPTLGGMTIQRMDNVGIVVEDLEDTIARLRRHGGELVGEVGRYEDSYLLCYFRGPGGFIIGLAEQLS
jgi:predicted enzyme related to lactoylglutathione lyase